MVGFTFASFSPKDSVRLGNSNLFWVLYFPFVDECTITGTMRTGSVQCLPGGLENKEEGSHLVLQSALYTSLFKSCWSGHFSGLSIFRNHFSRKRPWALWSHMLVTLVMIFSPILLPRKQAAKVDVRAPQSLWMNLLEPLSHVVLARKRHRERRDWTFSMNSELPKAYGNRQQMLVDLIKNWNIWQSFSRHGYRGKLWGFRGSNWAWRWKTVGPVWHKEIV